MVAPLVGALDQYYRAPFNYHGGRGGVAQPTRYIDPMLGRRRRRRANIHPALGQCIVLAERLLVVNKLFGGVLKISFFYKMFRGLYKTVLVICLILFISSRACKKLFISKIFHLASEIEWWPPNTIGTLF